MKVTRLIYVLAMLASTLTATSQLSYDEASLRAGRFFGYREWASAAALYNYMLEKRPDVTDTYGHAIVAQEMQGDARQSMDLLKRAMAHKIPLDSVLQSVRTEAFKIGRADMYEQFMLQSASENPWMARPLDGQLLKYYAFRNDGPKIVEYAKRMLNGAPDDTRFLGALAKGYLLIGDNAAAVDTWQRIVAIDPKQYQTLLYLANYFQAAGDKARALDYFERSQALKRTPYVEAMIQELQ